MYVRAYVNAFTCACASVVIIWYFCQLKGKTAAEIEQWVLIELRPCPNDKAGCPDIPPDDKHTTEDSKTFF